MSRVYQHERGKTVSNRIEPPANPDEQERQRIVLVADDEPNIVSMLDEYFSGLGYRVVTARDGEEVLARASCGPDIVLLDVGMPKLDGFETCRRLREHLDCPIVFLTARVEDVDALTGFEVGADDYVLKPFSLAVLGARVQSHLAREERRANRAEVRFDGDIVVDYRDRRVCVAGNEVDLTAREFDLVSFLSKHPGQVFERERIHERVWGWDCESTPAVVTEFVRRIRNKFANAGCASIVIETVWGMGYRWHV